MRARFPWLLLALALGLALFILLSERPGGPRAVRAGRARRALPVRTERVRRIEIRRGPLVLDLVRGDSGEWRMEAPLAARADDAAVLRFLHGIEQLGRLSVIEMENGGPGGGDWADYGLAPPEAVLRLEADGTVWTLEVGGLSPARDGVYLRIGGAPFVIRTEAGLLDWLPREAGDWRNRQVFSARPREVERLELRRPAGFLRAGRGGDGEWGLLHPFPARADRVFVESFLGEILGLRVEAFVADAEGLKAGYGFEESGREIVLEGPRLRDSVRRLQLGRSPPDRPDRLYATFRGEPSVFLVSAQAAAWAERPAADFRSRRLTPLWPHEVRSLQIRWGDRSLGFEKDPEGWTMTAPVAARAEPDRVALLAEAWTGAEILGFVDPPATDAWQEGWSEPAGVLVFGRDGASEPVRVAVHPRRTADGRLLARVNEDPSYAELSADLADTLALDPMLFRHLTVLQIDPRTLQWIRQRRDGMEAKVARAADGAWTSDGGAVRREALDRLLEALGELRALAWVRHGPTDLAAFGLDPPHASLTLHQSGAEGFVLTLVLGRDGGLGRYGMIRGHDTVFLLDRKASDVLSLPLVDPETGAGE